MDRPHARHRSFDALRAEFPALERCTYVNTQAYPPGARAVVDAVDGALRRWVAGHDDWMEWEHAAERSRDAFARLIGASPMNVGLVGSLAEASSTVASSVDVGRIVVGAREFRSSLHPFLANRAGCEVRVVEPRNGVQRVDDLVAAIDERTALVVVSSVQSANGYRGDLAPLVERAHSVGARVYVNLTQSAGVHPIDVVGEGIDFAAAHGYKWLLAPRGAGWLYVRSDLVESVAPLAPNWKSVVDPYATLYGPPYQPSPTATRFDCSLAWFSWVGADAALELVAELDRPAVQQHCCALADALRSRCAELGVPTTYTDEPTHIVGIGPLDTDRALDIFRTQGVVASARDGFVRVGFHAFNNESDLDFVTAALHLVTAS